MAEQAQALKTVIEEKKESAAIAAARAEVTEFIRKKAARKAAREAAKKKFWEEYQAQLEKSVPNQGGAHHGRNRTIRAWVPWS